MAKKSLKAKVVETTSQRSENLLTMMRPILRNIATQKQSHVVDGDLPCSILAALLEWSLTDESTFSVVYVLIRPECRTFIVDTISTINVYYALESFSPGLSAYDSQIEDFSTAICDVLEAYLRLQVGNSL